MGEGHMGRPRIGERPMTAAERQRRHRLGLTAKADDRKKRRQAKAEQEIDPASLSMSYRKRYKALQRRLKREFDERLEQRVLVECQRRLNELARVLVGSGTRKRGRRGHRIKRGS